MPILEFPFTYRVVGRRSGDRSQKDHLVLDTFPFEVPELDGELGRLEISYHRDGNRTRTNLSLPVTENGYAWPVTKSTAPSHVLRWALLGNEKVSEIADRAVRTSAAYSSLHTAIDLTHPEHPPSNRSVEAPNHILDIHRSDRDERLELALVQARSTRFHGGILHVTDALPLARLSPDLSFSMFSVFRKDNLPFLRKDGQEHHLTPRSLQNLIEAGIVDAEVNFEFEGKQPDEFDDLSNLLREVLLKSATAFDKNLDRLVATRQPAVIQALRTTARARTIALDDGEVDGREALEILKTIASIASDKTLRARITSTGANWTPVPHDLDLLERVVSTLGSRIQDDDLDALQAFAPSR